MRERHKTRTVRIGDVAIGGDNPIRIQSMCNTKTENVEATVAQIRALAAAGCEIIRVAVPNEAAALALKDIRRQIKLPLVADIHFDYRLALAAMENGADKIRINPGNIGEDWKLREVERAQYPDPSRCELRFARKGNTQKIRRSHGRGHRGIRTRKGRAHRRTRL